MTTTAELLLASSSLDSGTALEHLQNLDSGTAVAIPVVKLELGLQTTQRLNIDCKYQSSVYNQFTSNLRGVISGG